MVDILLLIDCLKDMISQAPATTILPSGLLSHPAVREAPLSSSISLHCKHILMAADTFSLIKSETYKASLRLPSHHILYRHSYPVDLPVYATFSELENASSALPADASLSIQDDQPSFSCQKKKKAL